MESTERALQCVVVTPERAVLDEPADFVALPMYDGELGVLPGRAPLIGRLGYGELRLRRGNDTKRYFVDSGFAQIRNNIVTVLTPRAVRAEEIDLRQTEERLRQAQLPASAAAQVENEKNQARARAQLRIARRGQGED
jgi:F-type H+-transporting ATPase subunit epsilon